MNETDSLPPDMLLGASLRGNEYAWTVADFPRALARAEAHGYACLGGQFQFRVPDGGTCEMYWLDADSSDRCNDELWEKYSHRSCREVLEKFRKRIAETDFAKEAASWPVPINAERDLVFVASLITENHLAEIAKQKKL